MGHLLWCHTDANYVCYSSKVDLLKLMVDSGLYNLHQAVHMHPDVNTPLNYQETTAAALNTLTRMVIDIAYAFNRECGSSDIEILHPAFMHIVRCAQQHLLTTENYNDPNWLEDFDQIRKVLVYFNRRWVLAGEFC